MLGVMLMALGGIALAGYGVHHLLCLRALRSVPRRPRLERYPSVTVIRPIRGLDSGAEDNVRAALDTGYPGEVETLFVFDDESEPVLPIARRVIAELESTGARPDARVLLCGEPAANRTGKLNAMIVALREARGEVIVFADSDIRPGPEALRTLVDTLLSSNDTGAAFAPVLVQESPVTVGDMGYAVALNGFYGPAAAWVANKNGGELPFIMGQFMAFRREAIDAIGGLECAEGQLVDDMYLGMRVRDAGYRNRMSPVGVPIIQQNLPYGEFLTTYRKWIAFSRTGLPARGFKTSSYVRGLTAWFGVVIAAVAVATGHWAAAVLGGLLAVSVSASLIQHHRAMGGGPIRARLAWVPLAFLLGTPFLLVSVMLQREVDWRGRSYRLDSRARLAKATPSADGSP